MNCRELERLFGAGAGSAELSAHRRSCAECERLGRDVDAAASMAESLQAPAWSPALRRALLEIPRQTVSCEGADALIARALEGEIADADEKRLQGHLSRCGGCRESAAALFAMRDLAAPEAPPWLATRLVAARPKKKKSALRSAFSGKAVVAYAYAAAVLVMLLGLNPTAVARKTGFASLGESTRNAVTVAQSSMGDRLGALQERALRTLAVWKGHIGGYGRAAVSNAIAIVWRPEPKKTPSRPRLGKEGGAAAGSDEFFTAAIPNREPFRPRFRV
jgi:hypothetical protein